jgi:hypothetical protein
MNIDTLTNHDLLQLMGGNPSEAEAQAMMDILKKEFSGKTTEHISDDLWQELLQRAIRAAEPQYKPIVISRTGTAPLKFSAQLTDQNGSGAGWKGSTQDVSSTRWTEVWIYKTKGGKYVAKVARISQWQNEETKVEAQAFTEPSELIDYLKNEDGLLGEASQEAVEAACKDLSEFRDAFVEVVE